MTSKSGFFVFILIASGCLSKACGDGEISNSPRSYEAAPTPDQSNVDEPASRVKGAPYAHVTPADIGVTIGPGVIAPYPTEVYDGSCTITQDGTTIENKIVNCPAQLKIDANNVTIRNSVVTITNNVDGSGTRMGKETAISRNFLMEYSHLNVPEPTAAVMNVWGGGNEDFRNFTIRNSHVEGGFHMFDMAGNIDGALFENNVLGPFGCVTGDPHMDVWIIGGKQGAWGTVTIRGNWIFKGTSQCTSTAIWFGAYGTMNAIIESNHLTTFGAHTLWASDGTTSTGPDTMQVRYNIYDAAFESQVGGRCAGAPECSGGSGPACCGYPSAAAKWNPKGAPLGSAVCNRYESDGSFVEQEYIVGVTHVTTGCPDYP